MKEKKYCRGNDKVEKKKGSFMCKIRRDYREWRKIQKKTEDHGKGKRIIEEDISGKMRKENKE